MRGNEREHDGETTAESEHVPENAGTRDHDQTTAGGDDRRTVSTHPATRLAQRANARVQQTDTSRSENFHHQPSAAGQESSNTVPPRDGCPNGPVSTPIHDHTRGSDDGGTANQPLKIGRPDSSYERDADHVAASAIASLAGQDETSARSHKTTDDDAGAADAPASVDRVLSKSGTRLDPTVRNRLEPHLDTDLDDVRIHTGREAAQSAEEMDARAYTVGNHIVFNRDEYDPKTLAGLRVLTHELAHVDQQADGKPVVQPMLGRKQSRTQETVQYPAEVLDYETTADPKVMQFLEKLEQLLNEVGTESEHAPSMQKDQAGKNYQKHLNKATNIVDRVKKKSSDKERIKEFEKREKEFERQVWKIGKEQQLTVFKKKWNLDKPSWATALTKDTRQSNATSYNAHVGYLDDYKSVLNTTGGNTIPTLLNYLALYDRFEAAYTQQLETAAQKRSKKRVRSDLDKNQVHQPDIEEPVATPAQPQPQHQYEDEIDLTQPQQQQASQQQAQPQQPSQQHPTQSALKPATQTFLQELKQTVPTDRVLTQAVEDGTISPRLQRNVQQTREALKKRIDTVIESESMDEVDAAQYLTSTSVKFRRELDKVNSKAGWDDDHLQIHRRYFDALERDIYLIRNNFREHVRPKGRSAYNGDIGRAETLFGDAEKRIAKGRKAVYNRRNWAHKSGVKAWMKDATGLTSSEDQFDPTYQVLRFIATRREFITRQSVNLSFDPDSTNPVSATPRQQAVPEQGLLHASKPARINGYGSKTFASKAQQAFNYFQRNTFRMNLERYASELSPTTRTYLESMPQTFPTPDKIDQEFTNRTPISIATSHDTERSLVNAYIRKYREVANRCQQLLNSEDDVSHVLAADVLNRHTIQLNYFLNRLWAIGYDIDPRRERDHRRYVQRFETDVNGLRKMLENTGLAGPLPETAFGSTAAVEAYKTDLDYLAKNISTLKSNLEKSEQRAQHVRDYGKKTSGKRQIFDTVKDNDQRTNIDTQLLYLLTASDGMKYQKDKDGSNVLDRYAITPDHLFNPDAPSVFETNGTLIPESSVSHGEQPTDVEVHEIVANIQALARGRISRRTHQQNRTEVDEYKSVIKQFSTREILSHDENNFTPVELEAIRQVLTERVQQNPAELDGVIYSFTNPFSTDYDHWQTQTVAARNRELEQIRKQEPYKTGRYKMDLGEWLQFFTQYATEDLSGIPRDQLEPVEQDAVQQVLTERQLQSDWANPFDYFYDETQVNRATERIQELEQIRQQVRYKMDLGEWLQFFTQYATEDLSGIPRDQLEPVEQDAVQQVLEEKVANSTGSPSQTDEVLPADAISEQFAGIENDLDPINQVKEWYEQGMASFWYYWYSWFGGH